MRPTLLPVSNLLRCCVLLLSLFMLLCDVSAESVFKPTGTFASSGYGTPEIFENPNLRGVLARTTWKEVEPSPGVFDFSDIVQQIDAIEAEGKLWSLSVNAGSIGSPDWLIDSLGADYVDATFRSDPVRLPLYWDPVVQERLAMLAVRLAEEYNDNPKLALVYISQMTSNGIEGHLQGVDMNLFASSGYSADVWVGASKQAAKAFAAAFDKKALAFEVHDIDQNAVVPLRIINELWEDPDLEERVGAGMWWISGKTSYQSELIAGLTEFPGDIYGQVIGRSDQVDRFQDEDYESVYTQAKEIGIRYIEPWEYEFRNDDSGANGEWDNVFADFNAWADETFSQLTVSYPDIESLSVSKEGARLILEWEAQEGIVYSVHKRNFSSENSDWQFLAEFDRDSDQAETISLSYPLDHTTVWYRVSRQE